MDSFSALVNTVTKEVSNPNMLAALVLCALLAITHAGDPATSMVTKFVDWLATMPSAATLATFLKSRITATVGAVCYTVTVWMVAPVKKRGTWTAIGLAFAYLVPESSVYQYVAQCLLLAMYLRASRQDVRTIIVVVGAVLYVLGILTTTASGSGGGPASPAPPTSSSMRSG